MVKPVKLSAYNLFKQLYIDTDRKSVIQIFSEILSLAIYWRSFPRHYFSRYLFKKGRNNIRDYFPDDFLYYKIKPLLNDKNVTDVVENKLYFHFYYSQFKINLPSVLMYNHRKLFVTNNEYFEVKDANNFAEKLGDLFLSNPAIGSLIIKKTYGSYGGNKVYKVVRDHFARETEIVTHLYNEVIQSGYLIQETIKQHPELNMLNPSSLNTIRFDTYISSSGEIDIISAYIRMNTVNYFIDNISMGGCMVGIELTSGKLKKEGFSNFSTNGVRILTFHPVTQVKFEGFEVPFFTEAKELVKKVAALMPGLRIIGWDVAIGESGPILIEGNSDYNMAGNDLTEGGYLTNATFRKVLRELGLKDK